MRVIARAGRAACGLPFLFWAVAACAQLAPDPASGIAPKRIAAGQRFMVAAAHPLAVDAGYEVLKRGGTAMDAAVAVQLVLGLVEPQSAGLGGGAFIVHYSAADKRVRTYDGRETAPASARPDRFTGAFGRPMGFIDSVLSGKSVGVPGALAVLELAHRNHGRLEWAGLAAPAIELAEKGFAISPRLHALLEWDKWLARDPFAARYLYDASGRPKPVGTTLRNPEYAATLREVAADGAQAFYRGAISTDLVAAVRNHPVGGGDLTVEDLASYQPKDRAPVCGPFREYRVCGMGPPSSGGIAVLQILGLLERLPKTDFAREPLQAVHYFAEAARLAYADRDRYVADPDFVDVPIAGLLAPTYLAERARLIAADRSLVRAQPGRPPGAQRTAFADGVTLDLPSTTHFSIVDAEGNAVALTASIEFVFGNHRFVRGFLLNNELTDFSFVAEEGGRPVANRVESRKRPRSSMSPTLVFDADGRLVLIVGSPGGHAIIHYVARVIVAALDWGMPLQQAVDAPHFGSRNGPTDLEAGTPVEGLRRRLEALGHPVRIVELASGVHAIQRVGDAWVGAADPRRDGAARGE
ncbi:MAG TPA: gamma-glutamyltransferase [Burkholderiales bacterium]|nr:gamma-glutamyltransferase [Burkholderiales bacterium]